MKLGVDFFTNTLNNVTENSNFSKYNSKNIVIFMARVISFMARVILSMATVVLFILHFVFYIKKSIVL